ncbi:hypothetical protein B9Q04_20605 [Candidatus Marsarchaeota G2 archaeon BE_D]|jgi:hypothetical protein|uniref:CopG family transcriptional regulator n=1 Tax=Candidatus Marsarchaeota G2 archaeon BE_D TaxID=1978158 RepID=A0A2R6BSP9_9ARCH|nr:MAG: hypothetical protein B9Q04_20605 [Candidatus Marsarchaeota G2 archaeon BE_D]
MGKKSDVVSVKVPRAVKKEMERLSEKINWAEEIRSFITNRIRLLHAEQNVKNLEETISKLPELPEGAVSSLVRADRDSH